MASRCLWWNRCKRETQLVYLRCIIRLNRVIIIIAGGAQKSAAMYSEGSYRIIKNLQDGITSVSRNS